MAIWQDLVDQSAFPGVYESVKRYVRQLRGTQSLEPCAVILTAPGEEAQVDYGDGPMVRDPLSGKHRRTRLFVHDSRLQPQVRPAAGVQIESRKSGRSCTNKPSAGSAEHRGWWCWTTCGKACSSPTSTTHR